MMLSSYLNLAYHMDASLLVFLEEEGIKITDSTRNQSMTPRMEDRDSADHARAWNFPDNTGYYYMHVVRFSINITLITNTTNL